MSLRRTFACLLLALSFALAAALAGMSATVSAAGDDVIALSLASGAIETLIATFAVAAALFAAGDPRSHLGLVPTGFGAAPTALLIAGTLGLSHALDARADALAASTRRARSPIFASSLHGARGLPLAGRGDRHRRAAGDRRGAAVPRPAPAQPAYRASARRRDRALARWPSARSTSSRSTRALRRCSALYLGIAGHWSGSVLVPIVCHAVNNLLAVGRRVVDSARPTSASPLDVAAGSALAAAALAFDCAPPHAPGLQPAPGSVDG